MEVVLCHRMRDSCMLMGTSRRELREVGNVDVGRMTG